MTRTALLAFRCCSCGYGCAGVAQERVGRTWCCRTAARVLRAWEALL